MEHNKKENPWVVTFLPEDTLEDKLKKASHVRPSDAQLAWMEKEYLAFIHFGPNTFSGRQWGTGSEDPSAYAPECLDPLQWVSVCAQAGMKMAMLTLKHHDGFCQWFTDTTDYSIANTTVNKDIAALLQKGCDTQQIGLGVYLSPWDMYQRDKGLWGTEEYNNYFLAQLSELLSRYGSVDEVWFDGACGDYQIWESVPTYKPKEWYNYIEAAQPNAVFRMYDPYYFASEEKWGEINTGKGELEWRGKAVRWVGNEEGKSRLDEWSVQPVYDRVIAENATFSDLGQEKYYQSAAGAVWYPVEVNTTILNQWFWNPETSKVKSLSQLVDIYYNSIGNNGVLLLNISPDRKGLIPEDQIQGLMKLKEFIDRTFHINLAAGAVAAATEEAPEHKADFILDNNKMTYWTTSGEWDINRSSASVIFDLGCDKVFDNVLLQEYIREGQRVAEWTLEAWTGETWKELAHYKSIGYKNIKRFEKVTSSKVRFNILRSWDNPMISNFGLYLTDIPEETVGSDNFIRKELNPEEVESDNMLPGLGYTYFSEGIQTASLIESISTVKREKIGVVNTICTSPAEIPIGYSFSFQGYINISLEGVYTIRLESTDGSVFFINGELVIDNDEPHGLRAIEKVIALKAGYYPLKLLYTSFRQSGYLKMSWSGPGFVMKEIAADYLFHMPDLAVK